MRVAIDSRTLGAPKTGDRTYCLNLLRGMATLRPEGEFLLYTDRETGLLDSLPPNFERVVLTAPQPWLWTPWSLPWDLRRRSADARQNGKAGNQQCSHVRLLLARCA